MTAFGALLGILVFLGFVLVGFSARYRFTSKGVFRWAPMDEATNDRWRFGFFIAWTLSLPLVWLVEWHVYYGGLYEHWKLPTPFPEFTYGRKVLSDMWTAVTAVLGLLAWNTKPELNGRDLAAPSNEPSGTSAAGLSATELLETVKADPHVTTSA